METETKCKHVHHHDGGQHWWAGSGVRMAFSPLPFASWFGGGAAWAGDSGRTTWV